MSGPGTRITPVSIADCGPNFCLLSPMLSLCMLHNYFTCGLVEYFSTVSHRANLLMEHVTLQFKSVGMNCSDIFYILLSQILSSDVIRMIEVVKNK